MHEDPDERPSKSARKREHRELQQLAVDLIELPESRLAKLPLGERMREELMLARSMSPGGARNRQVRLLAQLLQDEDLDALRAGPRDEAQRHHAETARHHAAEALRERLLGEGTAALDGMAASSEQRSLAQRLVHEATGLGDGVRARHARRELYRLAQQLLGD